MPTDPAPEKVAALAAAFVSVGWVEDDTRLGADILAALNAAGYDVARIEEGERAALDAAWAAAEARLPEKWEIGLLERNDGGWLAGAYGPEDGYWHGRGPTPASALDDLRAPLDRPRAALAASDEAAPESRHDEAGR